ncbi:acyl carrier protein [Butyrivibrio sp. NC2007]|uniref:acyl carrier protein n=1 Tax=Butyrivibrio sp. NC2007 TaxID=1280683 RepID=UPI0003B47E6B|nr:phosphopantetheine-binding protein [Butyrivibrio sp. NC2007]
MNGEILNKIKEIIMDISDIDVSEIQLDSSIMDDLDLSSVEAMTILAEIQRAYNITISANELMDVETVGELVELIDRKIQ